MSQQPQNPIFYLLKYDLDRLNPDLGGSEVNLVYPREVTGLFTTVDGPEEATLDLRFWLRGCDPIEVEEPVQFTGFLPSILETDAPIGKPPFPLYSKRFLNTLEAVGDIAYRSFSTQIEDDVTGAGDDDYLLGRISEDFVLIQFPHLDILDLEKSTYSSYDEELGMVTALNEVVLKVPETGLPPAFRLKAYSPYILVSAAAKTALEQAGVRGVRFALNPYS